MASSDSPLPKLKGQDRAALAAYPGFVAFLALFAEGAWVAIHGPLVDGPLVVVALAGALAAGCTLRGSRQTLQIARIAGVVLLALGFVVSLLLVSAMGALYGAYGTFGKAGASLGAVLLCAWIPMLVVFPWLWLRALSRLPILRLKAEA